MGKTPVTDYPGAMQKLAERAPAPRMSTPVDQDRRLEMLDEQVAELRCERNGIVAE